MMKGQKDVTAVVAASLGLCLTAGCEGSEGQQTFYVGWTILGLIVLGILVLFGGLVRYIRQGAKNRPKPQEPMEYEYEVTDSGDDDDPFRH